MMKIYIPQSVIIWKPDWELPPLASRECNGSWKAKLKHVFTHSIDTQSIIAIFCKNILSFLGQKMAQNYLHCFLTPWNIRSHICKHVKLTKCKHRFFPLSLDIGMYIRHIDINLDTGWCCWNKVLYHSTGGEGVTGVLGQRIQATIPLCS